MQYDFVCSHVVELLCREDGVIVLYYPVSFIRPTAVSLWNKRLPRCLASQYLHTYIHVCI